MSGQLLRSGTAPAPHYSEARGAESSRDFIHKLGICLKELNQIIAFWLKIIIRSQMLPEASMRSILEECNICRIISSSIKTARSNQR